MKKILITSLVALGLSGGAFLGATAYTESVYSEAYADGVAAADVDPAPAADAAPPAIPSADDPLAGASTIWKMWKAGALIPAVILAAFLIVVLLLKYVPRLNRGRIGIYLTALVASVGIIIERAAAGSTPNTEMLVGAVLGFALFVVRAEFPSAVPKAG